MNYTRVHEILAEQEVYKDLLAQSGKSNGVPAFVVTVSDVMVAAGLDIKTTRREIILAYAAKIRKSSPEALAAATAVKVAPKPQTPAPKPEPKPAPKASVAKPKPKPAPKPVPEAKPHNEPKLAPDLCTPSLKRVIITMPVPQPSAPVPAEPVAAKPAPAPVSAPTPVVKPEPPKLGVPPAVQFEAGYAICQLLISIQELQKRDVAPGREQRVQVVDTLITCYTRVNNENMAHMARLIKKI